MNKGHMRLVDICFPLSGIAAALMDFPYVLTEIFMVYYMLQVLSLCAVDSFRNAAAQERDVQGINRRFGGGLAQLGIGFILCAVMGCIGGEDFAYVASTLLVLCSVTFVLIEQLFEERMRALGKSGIALRMGIVSAMLFIAGVFAEEMLALDEPFYGMILFCCTGLGTAIAGFQSHRTAPLEGLSFQPRNMRFCAKACVQTLLFPTALFFMLLMEIDRGERYIPVVEWETVLPLCLGLIPWRLCRAVHRRTREESRGAGFIALASGALGVIACALLELMPYGFDHIELARICADTLVLAMMCSVIVFCRANIRLCAGMALVAAAGWLLRIYIPYGELIVAAMCVLAVIANLKDIFPGKK